MIKIRKAIGEDLKEIVELYIEFFKRMNRFAKFVSKKKPTINKNELKDSIIKRIKPSGKNLFLVAEEENKLLGFVHAEVMSSRESKTDKKVVGVIDIYAKQKRKGIGKKLLEEVEAWANLKNTKFIQWEFIYGNDLAEKFCIKNKFKHFKVKMLKELK